MLRQFLVRGAVSIVNITIHALVMTIVVRVAQAASVNEKSHPSLSVMAVMIPTVSVLMITHTIEVIVCALILDRRRYAARSQSGLFCLRQLRHTRLR